jgi:predicted ATPase
MRQNSPDILETITEWTRLVFPDLRELNVSQDPHTGKYIGSLIVARKSQELPLKIPFQSASDGTLKWLSLISLITTTNTTHCIEEPENFLHPKMQQFLVQIIRDHVPEMGRASYFVISTHSETLINECDPAELVLFKFQDGRTVCNRLKSADRMHEEINRTGFGLGYFYAANAIS